MTSNAWRSLANFTLATVGGLVGLALGLLGLAGVTVRDGALILSLVVGASLLGASSIVAFALGVWQFRKALVRDPLAEAGMVVGTHVTRWAQSGEDITNAYHLFTRLLPDDSSVNLRMMHDLFTRNRETTFLVERADGQARLLVGMGVVAPLTDAACRGVLAKEIKGVADADLITHIGRDWVRPPGVYIGGAAADPQDPTGVVRVLDFLGVWITMSAAPICFAYPASAKGRRIMEHTGFHPIGGGTPMWMLRGRHLTNYRNAIPVAGQSTESG